MSGKPEGEDFKMERGARSKKQRGAKVHCAFLFDYSGKRLKINDNTIEKD